MDLHVVARDQGVAIDGRARASTLGRHASCSCSTKEDRGQDASNSNGSPLGLQGYMIPRMGGEKSYGRRNWHSRAAMLYTRA
jgi:hypothetical protein